MAESLRSRLVRWRFNRFPAFRRTGGRIVSVSEDWRELTVELRLGRATRNLVGTIFGGSLFGAVDPFCMVMLMRNLGPGYVVWDKAAAIRFRRPGRGTLTARFSLDEAELAAIRSALETEKSVDRVYRVELVDAEGATCAEVERTVYIARRADEG